MANKIDIDADCPAESMIENVKSEPRAYTLGSVRLRHAATNDIILVPAPSQDSNDPLNWSKWYRVYLAVITCAAIFMAQFLAAGPSVDMINIVHDVLGATPTSPTWNSSLAKTSYFFTGTAFVQGMSNLFYMPLIVKYGRRPVYILSFAVYGGCALWAGLAKSYASELTARLIMGFAGGSAECLAPLTIADIFFLHERGHIMSMYSAALSFGIAGGIILSGLITIHESWRVIYYLACGLIWTIVIIITLTMPETAFKRQPIPYTDNQQEINAEWEVPRQTTYAKKLKLFTGIYTSESLLRLFWRPVPLLLLPPVFWATLCQSVSIGSFVAISSNFASAFSNTYGFATWQIGLSYTGVLIGALAGIWGCGWLSDATADWLTRRNEGIRESEMRLPTLSLSMVLGPLSLLLYGYGIAKEMHWIVPIVGLGLLGFVITQVSNIVIVYAVDAYRPVAGEVVVSQLSFKAAFGFLLSFYTNPWVDSAGYVNSFGTLAGINGGLLLLWIPMYIWGKKIRVATISWKIMSGVRWDDDREVGE